MHSLLDEKDRLGTVVGSLNGSTIPLDKNSSPIRCVGTAVSFLY